MVEALLSPNPSSSSTAPAPVALLAPLYADAYHDADATCPSFACSPALQLPEMTFSCRVGGASRQVQLFLLRHEHITYYLLQVGGGGRGGQGCVGGGLGAKEFRGTWG